jgi:DeoR/GlpR family transcriptional regulator of sugar metabolism
MRAARQTILLADSGKFQPRSFCEVCNVNALAEIITDDGLSPDLQQILRRSEVKLTLVASGGT